MVIGNITSGLHFAKTLSLLYGDAPDMQIAARDRYRLLLEEYQAAYGDAEPVLFSTPGRVELGGNHTDHSGGRVLAASIQLDTIAAAARSEERSIRVSSAGFPLPFHVSLDKLDPCTSDEGSTTGLIRGIAARFQQLGYRIGGFHAVVMSDILPGSGLSSSASIEVLIGSILNGLYNDGEIPPEVLAGIGQYAENTYFGKPCGLMDQLACAIGGIVAIDFEDPRQPLIERIGYLPADNGLQLAVVHTGGSHSDLTEDYAAVPREMQSVARQLGVASLRDLSFTSLLESAPGLREAVGDRAILRALHFVGENERVLHQMQALREGDSESFLCDVRASGLSSCRWLQNCSTPRDVSEQGIMLALAATEHFLRSAGRGACRVHGGGFAGTIQVFLPDASVPGYVRLMEHLFGAQCVALLSIRTVGTVALTPECHPST